MEIKDIVKNYLITSPKNMCAERELYKMSEKLNIDVSDLEKILDDMFLKNLIDKKIEYKCESCHETEILNEDLLNKLMDDYGEYGYFQCGVCFNAVNIDTNKTGYVYFDVINYNKLKEY